MVVVLTAQIDDADASLQTVCSVSELKPSLHVQIPNCQTFALLFEHLLGLSFPVFTRCQIWYHSKSKNSKFQKQS